MGKYIRISDLEILGFRDFFWV